MYKYTLKEDTTMRLKNSNPLLFASLHWKLWSQVMIKELRNLGLLGEWTHLLKGAHLSKSLWIINMQMIFNVMNHLESHRAPWVSFLLCLHLAESYLCILRMLRMVLDFTRKRNHLMPPPWPRLKSPTFFLTSVPFFFTVSSSNNPFLISKVCATRLICYCLNEEYPSRNLKGNWLPTPSESSVTSRKVTWPLEPSTCFSVRCHLLHDWCLH